MFFLAHAYLYIPTFLRFQLQHKKIPTFIVGITVIFCGFSIENFVKS